MKKTNLLLLSIASVMLISCESPDSMLLEKLQKRNVPIASGINFDTGEPIVINPANGKEVKACKNTPYSDSYDKNNSMAHQKGCGIELVSGDEADFIKSVIEKGKKNITGKIKRDGEIKDARFFVTVTVLYKGSTCGTEWRHGKEYYCCSGVCTPEG